MSDILAYAAHCYGKAKRQEEVMTWVAEKLQAAKGLLLDGRLRPETLEELRQALISNPRLKW